MKTFANANARDRPGTRASLGSRRRRRPARRRSPAAAAICSQLVKDRIVSPDVIVNLQDDPRTRSGDESAAAA